MQRILLLPIGMALLPACAGVLGKPLRPPPPRVAVLALADSSAERTKAEGFSPLSDSSAAPLVATLRLRATHQRDSTLDRAYDDLRKQANRLGANAYRLRGTCSTSGPCEVEATVYDAAAEELAAEPLPPDAVVVFGPLEGRTDAVFKLNGEKRSLPPLHYLVYQNEGGEMTLSRGSFLTGATLTLNGGDGDPPSYWSTTGITVGPAISPGRSPGIGITLNAGRIHSVEDELGRFLVAVLHETDGDPGTAGR